MAKPELNKEEPEVLPFGAPVGLEPGVVRISHTRSDGKPDVVVKVTTN